MLCFSIICTCDIILKYFDIVAIYVDINNITRKMVIANKTCVSGKKAEG